MALHKILVYRRQVASHCLHLTRLCCGFLQSQDRADWCGVAHYIPPVPKFGDCDGYLSRRKRGLIAANPYAGQWANTEAPAHGHSPAGRGNAIQSGLTA
ncbi:MAG: hypothetical protein ACJASV_000830 [Pseudorhodobacter sp.]|jgi:hypothetical protein